MKKVVLQNRGKVLNSGFSAGQKRKDQNVIFLTVEKVDNIDA